MSAHPETIRGDHRAIEEAPAVEESSVAEEYSATRQDSLLMFGAAIGGAVFGVLFTLLVLALINGGTLIFNAEPQIASLEEAFTALSGNVDANTQNVNQLSTDINTLAEAANAQRGALGELNTSIGTLNETRDDFNLFVGALSDAITAIEGDETAPAEAAPSSAPAESASAAEAVSAPHATLESSDALAADELGVLIFVDANGDGALDADESAEMGVTVALVDAEGAVTDTAESTEDGLLFQGVAPGDYQLVVEESGALEALHNFATDVTVPEDAEQGQLLVIPLAAQ